MTRPQEGNGCIFGLGRRNHKQLQKTLPVSIIPHKEQQRALGCAGPCGRETCSDDQDHLVPFTPSLTLCKILEVDPDPRSGFWNPRRMPERAEVKSSRSKQNRG